MWFSCTNWKFDSGTDHVKPHLLIKHRVSLAAFAVQLSGTPRPDEVSDLAAAAKEQRSEAGTWGHEVGNVKGA